LPQIPLDPEQPPDSQVFTSSDVSMLDMRITASGPTARLVTLRSQWVHNIPVSLGPVTITHDPYSIQLHVRNELFDDDALLVRFDTIDDIYTMLQHTVPFGGRGRLVQLADQGVWLALEDGALRGVPLIDLDVWLDLWQHAGSGGESHVYNLIELPDVVDFEVSGVGQLLLRREDAPARVVHIACVQ
jgi:hypothetical protein